MSEVKITPKIEQILKDTAALSHDPHRPVGVVIADRTGSIISTGSNRPPERFAFEQADTLEAIRHDPSWKYYMMEHAERNAILEALKRGSSLKGAVMYGTLFPCSDCARAIVAAGIERLVVPKPGIHPERDERWRSHYEYARKIFDLGGVQVDFYDPAAPS